MSFHLEVKTQNDSIKIELEMGETLFVLGANGAGKSSLMQKLYIANQTSSRRISAHRQTWFDSGALSLSPAQKKNSQINIGNYDAAPDSRWKDDYAAQRPNIALFDLIDSQNVRARAIAAAVDSSNNALANDLSKKDAPLRTINELLRLSNIAVNITVEAGDQIMATRAGSSPYSIAQLSDGERNALLIASAVLTAPAGTLMLIDEPERHLHRSIISPLLTNLFRQRSDCAFVVSTHDVELCTDNPDTKVLLLRGCIYKGDAIESWDADYLSAQGELDDTIRKNIVGGRRKIIFVEGVDQSLDRPLYSIIFPNVTVVPTASCRDVEHTVTGIRTAGKLHWVKAWGIVDNDHRTTADIEKLKAIGIYALDYFSVESIYFHPEIQKKVALRQASVDGGDATSRIAQAITDAILAIRPHVQRLGERIAEKELREIVMSRLPTRSAITVGTAFSIDLDVAEVVHQEVDRLSKALDSGDFLTAIAHYPLRETPALNKIVSSLGFKSRSQYEGAVLKLLIDDADALAFTKSLFADLIQEIEAI